MSMLRCFGSTVYQITRVATSEFRFKSRELSFHVSDLNGANAGTDLNLTDSTGLNEMPSPGGQGISKSAPGIGGAQHRGAATAGLCKRSVFGLTALRNSLQDHISQIKFLPLGELIPKKILFSEITRAKPSLK